MNQNDYGNFRTNKNMAHSFTHSCLGRFIIFAVIMCVILFFARLSVPSEQVMTEEIEDDIRQCILSHDSIRADWIDDAINNVGYIFTYADSAFDVNTWKTFEKNNFLEVHKHTFFSTMYVRNNLSLKPIRIGFGIFNTVIPTLSYEDLLLNVGPMQKDYGKGLIRTIEYGSDYMGEQPHIKEYHYKEDQTQ
jgi:hypothetical protein